MFFVKPLFSFLLGMSLALPGFAGTGSTYEMHRSVIGLVVAGSPETPPPKYPGEDTEKESPLTLTPASLSWTGAYVGTRTSQSVELKNGGSEPVRISGTHLTGSAFLGDSSACPTTLSSGASCLIVLHFLPTKEGDFSGVLNVVGEGFARKSVALQGSAIVAPLTVSPKVVDLGFINRGAPHFSKVTVSNNSTVAIPLALVPGSGLAKWLTADMSACGSTLAPSRTCDILVSVKGSAPIGPFASEIVLESGGQAYPVNVKGTIQDSVLELSSSALTFGNVLKSKSKSLSVLLLNSGNISVPVKSITVRGSPSMVVEHTCPNPLGAGAACSAKVTFTPSDYVSSSGVLEFVTGEAGNTLSVALTGTGEGAQVQWNPGTISFTHAGKPSFWKAPQILATVTNTSTISTEGVVFGYTGTGAVTLSNDCPVSLSPGSSCQVSGVFSSTPGSFSGTVTAKSLGGPVTSASLSYEIPLPQLSASPSAMSFGEHPFGETSTLSAVITNTGIFKTDVTDVGVSGAQASAFTATHDCSALEPGQTCTVSVAFKPVQPLSTAKLKLAYAGKELALDLDGLAVGAHLSHSPESVALGAVQLGTQVQRTVTVTNTGTAPLTALDATATGAGLSVSNACPSSLSPGGSCAVTLTANAQSLGDVSGTVKITADGGKSVLVPVTGRVGQSLLSLSSQVAKFPLVTPIGSTSDPLSVLVFNNAQSSEPLTVSSISLAGSTAFTASHNCTSIAAGGSCAIEFRFIPVNGNEQIATATVKSPFGDPVTVILSGTGLQSSLSFAGATDLGLIAVNASPLVPLTVTNSGNVPHTISTVTAASGTLSANNCSVGRVLNPGDSCSVSVTPNTSAAGPLSTSVTVTSNRGSFVSNLKGTVGALSLTVGPSALEFGMVPISEVPTKYVVLNNQGPEISLSAVAVTGTGFSLNAADSTCEGVSSTFKIPSNTSCRVAVNYTSASAVSSTGSFKYTWGGVVRDVPLSAQAIASAYTISGRTSSNTALVATQMLTYEPASIDGSATPNASFDVYLRNLSTTSNSVSVEVTGHPGFTVQLMRTTSSTIDAGSKDFGVAAGSRSGTVTTSSTYPHVGLRVRFTAQDRQPVTSEATVTFTVDGGATFSRTLTVVGRYNPASNFSAYAPPSNSDASANPLASVNFGSLLAPVGSVGGTSTYLVRSFGVFKGYGSVKGTLSIEGSPDFGFTGSLALPTGNSIGWFKKLPSGNANTNTLDTSPALVQLVSCVEYSSSSTQACALSIQIGFAPKSSGPKEAVLTFTPDPSTGLAPQSIRLYGQGVTALALTWGAAAYNTSLPANPLVGSVVSSYFITGVKPQATVSLVVKNTGQGVANGKFVVEGAPELGVSAVTLYNTAGGSMGTISMPAGTRDTQLLTGVSNLSTQFLVTLTANTTANGVYAGLVKFIPEAETGMPVMSHPIKLSITGFTSSAQLSSSYATAITPFPNNTVTFTPVSADKIAGLPVQTATAAVYVKNPGPVHLLEGSFAIESSQPSKFTIKDVYSSSTTSAATVIPGAVLANRLSTGVVKSYANTYEGDFRVRVDYSPTEISASDEATLVFTPSAGAIASGMPATPLRVTLKGSADYNVVGTPSTASATVAAPGSPWNFGAKSINASGLNSAPTITKYLYVIPSGTAGTLAGTFTYSGSPAFSVFNARAYVPTTGQFMGTGVGLGNKVVATHDVRMGLYNGTGISVQVDFAPTTIGTHTGAITWTPADPRLSPVDINITGTGANNANAEFSSVAGTSTPLSTYNAGAATAKVIAATSPALKVLPTIFIRNTGTNGSLGGTLSITGQDAASFELSGWGTVTGAATPYFASNCTISGAQLGTSCAGVDASYGQTSAIHLFANISFKPRRVGDHAATVTFTPHASLGLPAQTLTLQGRGEFNATGLLAEAPTGGVAAASGVMQTYFNPPGGSSAGGGTASKTFYVQPSGTNGFVGGTFSLSIGAPFKLSAAGYFTPSGSMSANCVVQSGGLSSTCVANTDVSAGSGYTGVYVTVQYTPTAALVLSGTELTYTPDASTGLAAQSVSISGRGRNDFIDRLSWSGSRDGSVAAASNFGLVNTTVDKVFYLTSPGAQFGSMGGTVSVEGANFKIQSAQLVQFSASESVVANLTTNGRTVAGLSLSEWSIGSPPSVLKVVIRATTDSSGNQLTGSLTFTPLSSAYGSSMSMGLVADTTRP